MSEREKLIDLIIAAKKDDPETGSFTEWLTDHLLANGATVQKWIPVTERMPEKNVDVLVFNGYGFFVAQFYTWHIGSVGLDRWSMPQYCDDPTHWMPLPKPPKEEP